MALKMTDNISKYKNYFEILKNLKLKNTKNTTFKNPTNPIILQK